MKKMLTTITQSLILSLLCFFSMHSQALELKSTVDRTSMNLSDLLRLEVTIDKQGSGNIDFSALNLQFTIIRSQKNSTASFVNGKLNTQTQWTLLLSPKEVGDLLIPSFNISGVYSDAISISVTNGVNNNKQSNSNNRNTNKTDDSSADVFLNATVNKNSVYVQEQLLLTLRLYYRVSLSGYTPSELVIDGITPTLVAENNSEEMFNGQRYNVLEKIYSIHPQSSGKMTIPKQVWQIERAFGRFSNSRLQDPYLSLSSQAHTITVNSVPEESTAKHWLPTTNLSASQQWGQSIISAKVGEPLNYSIIMQAQGLSHSQLPTIEFSGTEQFTIYSDQAKTNDQKDRGGINGYRTQQYAVIPKATGVFSFPVTTIKWWNTKTDKEETIIFPEQKIIVGNSDLGREQDRDTTALLNNATASNATSEVYPNNNTSVLIWQLSVLFLLVLSTILLWLWISTYKKLSAENKDQHDDNNHFPPQYSAKQEHRLASLYPQIEQVIQDQQWPILKPLLLQWASLSLGKTVINTDDLIQSYPQLHKDLEEVFILLDKQLYSENHVLVWDVKELVSLLKKQHQSKKTTGHKEQSHEASQLPPLYRSE